MKQNNDWLDVLREKVDGAEMTSPSDAGWEGVRAKLGKRGGGVENHTRRIRVFLIPAAAAVAVLLILFAPHITKDTEQLLSSNSQETNVASDIVDVQRAERMVLPEVAVATDNQKAAEGNVYAGKQPGVNRKTHSGKVAREELNTTLLAKNESASESTAMGSQEKVEEEEPNQPISTSKETAAEKSSTHASSHTQGRDKAILSQPHPDVIRTNSSSSPKWLLALGVSGVSSGAIQNGFPNVMETSALAAPARRAAPSLKGVLTKYDYAYSSFRHQMPMNVSLTVSSWLGKYWGVESGVSFTRLKTEVIPLFGTETYMQKVDYLGIPLRVNGRLPLTDKWMLYAGTGAQADYCLSATLDGEKQDERAFQYSLEAHAGLSYALDKGYDIYVEPDISWYLSETNLRTIHSQQPWAASLRVGIRIALP
ncbi:MAG: outer membrane beta-barrel protein [Bacteroidaceae bacterium]|nr:outer membrane beta-barrel protein [Bacteroidaceae bacterium]